MIDLWGNVNGLEPAPLARANVEVGFSSTYVRDHPEVIGHIVRYDLAHPVNADSWSAQAQAAGAHVELSRH